MTEPLRLPRDANLGEWLRGTGPHADLAICTRVRFARNVQDYRFAPCMDPSEARELTGLLSQQLAKSDFIESLTVLDLEQAGELERALLIERHLISRELATADRARAVAINQDESVSIMINEEDHLRAQVFHSGFAIPQTYERAERIDDALLQRLPLAFSEEFGFLTSCPTNTGTGLRVSVMLHLPGVVWAEEIERATHAAQKAHLAVRGLFGEGSRALGDFYQVSNQVTLGRTESQVCQDVQAAVDRLIQWERDVRQALLSGDKAAQTTDRIFRALGTLERARILSSEEGLNCLSTIRFGVEQGLLNAPTLDTLNRLLLLTQSAHLQQIWRETLSPPERDVRRADLVRAALADERR